MIPSSLHALLRIIGTSSIVLLAACGQKGPLIMPSTPPPPPPDAALTAPPIVSPAAPAPTPKTP